MSGDDSEESEDEEEDGADRAEDAGGSVAEPSATDDGTGQAAEYSNGSLDTYTEDGVLDNTGVRRKATRSKSAKRTDWLRLEQCREASAWFARGGVLCAKGTNALLFGWS